jgi:hypothetical protein
MRFILVQNCTKIGRLVLLYLLLWIFSWSQFASISRQNTRLDDEVDEALCVAHAGTETASSNLETLFKPNLP